MTRYFYLINADGATYDLNLVGRSILHSVDGLGYEITSEYERIGNRFAPTYDALSQGVIHGTVSFRQPGAYQKYFDFIRFLQNVPLRLMAKTPVGTFYRRGTVSAVNKAETAPLQCVVTFTCTTPWYRTVSESNDGTSSGGKVYDEDAGGTYTYDYNYADQIPGVISIRSDSYAKQGSPAKLTIYGPVTNPAWNHYVDGVLVADGAVTVEIPNDRKLVIDSTTIPYQIMQYDLLGHLVADDYQLSDFGTDRFLRFRYGTNTVSVSQSGGDAPVISLEAEIEYASI